MGALDRKVCRRKSVSGGLFFRNSRGGVDGAKNYGESERYNEGRDPASFSLDYRMDVKGKKIFGHLNPGGYIRCRGNGYSGSPISDYLNKGRIEMNVKYATRPWRKAERA